MKRLIIVAIGFVLLLNFAWFLLSFWPYQRLAKFETTRNAQGQTVTVESNMTKEIYKSNITTYIAINVGTMVLGVSASLFVKNRP